MTLWRDRWVARPESSKGVGGEQLRASKTRRPPNLPLHKGHCLHRKGSVYKLLLCWRYLLTRYLALACIVSVMLGVATLIVVNSVMAASAPSSRIGCTALLSDVIVESHPSGRLRRSRRTRCSASGIRLIGDKIEAMTPTMEIFGLIQFDVQRAEQIRHGR